MVAAEAGARAIYCEQPFAQSLDQADRMLAACDARGVKVAVAHQNRGWPAAWLVRDLIAGGKIGRLRAMRAWPKQDARGGAVEHLIHGTQMLCLICVNPRASAVPAPWGGYQARRNFWMRAPSSTSAT